jgi:hypothetical protein
LTITAKALIPACWKLLSALTQFNKRGMTDEYTQEVRQLPLSQLNATEDEVAIHFVLSSTSADLCSVSCVAVQWWLAILLLTKKQKSSAEVVVCEFEMLGDGVGSCE